MYSHLFTVEEVSDELWEQQLNPKSEVVMSNALVNFHIRFHIITISAFHSK